MVVVVAEQTTVFWQILTSSLLSEGEANVTRRSMKKWSSKVAFFIIFV